MLKRSQFIVQPARSLHGELTVPGDKSISHRAILLGAVAQGKTRIRYCLQSGDMKSSTEAVRALGISVTVEGEVVMVEGRGKRGLKAPAAPIDAGNSGTTARLLLGLLAGQPFTSTITGDPSLRSRPMRRVTEPLEKMGAIIQGPMGNDRLPLTVQGGGLKGIRYPLPVPSAQVKSALLLAGLYTDGAMTVVEPIPTRDHTERMLRTFGARLTWTTDGITIEPDSLLEARDLEVPGDLSSAAFFLSGAVVVAGSSVTVRRVGLNPTRTGFLELLKKMGASLEIKKTPSGQEWEPMGEVTARYSPLQGITVESAIIPGVIDELPILMVVATQANGRTVIEGAGELKVKETDRIRSMVTGLTAMGARIRSEGDTIVVEGPTRLRGAVVNSFGDHRTAMALSIAGLVAEGPTTIQESQWIDISFPGFQGLLRSLQR